MAVDVYEAGSHQLTGDVDNLVGLVTGYVGHDRGNGPPLKCDIPHTADGLARVYDLAPF